ncbi:RHS repeat domain-containing protein [uncultured Alistipes sp.]|uniref:RHS repeat domain-containing protein n=1 Tax=Alistipes sp. TaxID=1872444 RepID=UPI00266BD5AA|nr:RHS repeat-associated core domain-containing protein [uncultured Alistipes sp.]
MDPTNNVMAEYNYLADGTKLAVRDKAGNGYTYLGSLIYQSNGGRLSFESTLFNGGSILKTSSGYEVVYHVTDYLGSIRAVVDSSGKVLEYNNYYPFGERWQQTGPLFAGNRYRFNGKELQVTGQLGLLDYGARMYDPALARWQGCDPAMQMANPFVFSGNNPVVYVDKDGKFFWYIMAALAGAYFGGSAANNNWNPVKWDWGSGKTWGGFFGGAIQGTIGAAMMGYGLSALSGSGTTMLGQTLRTMVFYTNSAKIFATGASLINNFDNAMDIICGNYLYDGDNFGDMIRMSLSRSLWERPQQAFGYIYSHGRNGFRKGIDVSYFHGATVVNKANTSEHKGVTMGNMINGWNIYRDNSSMLYHEYGHVIQSRYFGPSYLFSVGIPSAIVAGKDNGYWTEVMANRFSRDYFGQDVWDQTAGSQHYKDQSPMYPTTY